MCMYKCTGILYTLPSLLLTAFCCTLLRLPVVHCYKVRTPWPRPPPSAAHAPCPATASIPQVSPATACQPATAPIPQVPTCYSPNPSGPPPFTSPCCPPLLPVPLGLAQPHEQLSILHLLPRANRQANHHTRARCVHHVLHLHRLKNQQGGARGHLQAMGATLAMGAMGATIAKGAILAMPPPPHQQDRQHEQHTSHATTTGS